jgi:serralysin
MPMHLNIWGPKADWDIGDPSLKAASNKSQNSTFELYVDSVKVEQLSSKIGTSAGESLQGTARNDHLDGQSGGDQLLGRAGHDTVYGDGGADRIAGGVGADHLWGGPQSDSFIYTRVAESAVDVPGRDTIEDFSRVQGDRIDVAAIDADVSLEGNQAFAFIGESAFHRTAGELRYELVDGQTLVSGDVTGDGVADFCISVRGQHAVDAGYFVL